MRTRVLGLTRRAVGEIGLGCWQFGGDFGPIEDARVIEILEAAVDAEITFLDTADVYGAGRSEQLIGDFLKSREESLFIASKVGRGGEMFPDCYGGFSVRGERSLEFQSRWGGIQRWRNVCGLTLCEGGGVGGYTQEMGAGRHVDGAMGSAFDPRPSGGFDGHHGCKFG